MGNRPNNIAVYWSPHVSIRVFACKIQHHSRRRSEAGSRAPGALSLEELKYPQHSIIQLSLLPLVLYKKKFLHSVCINKIYKKFAQVATGYTAI